MAAWPVGLNSMKLPFNLNIKGYLLRHLQVMLFSLGRLWRQPFASLLTVAVIGIALALPASLFVLLENMNSVSDDWDDASQISLFLKTELDDAKVNQFNASLLVWPEIASSVAQTSEQSLAEFRDSSGLGSVLDSLPDGLATTFATNQSFNRTGY